MNTGLHVPLTSPEAPEPWGPQSHKAGVIVVALTPKYVHRSHSSRAKEVSEPSLSATSDPRKGQSFCPCHPWSALLSLTTLLILLGLGWGICQCKDIVTVSGAYGKTTVGRPYRHRTSRTQKSYPTDILPFHGFKHCHVTRSTQWFVVTETALSVPIHLCAPMHSRPCEYTSHHSSQPGPHLITLLSSP